MPIKNQNKIGCGKSKLKLIMLIVFGVVSERNHGLEKNILKVKIFKCFTKNQILIVINSVAVVTSKLE